MRTVICILLSFVIIISSTHTAGAAIIVPVTNSSTTPDSTTISDAVNGFKNLSKKEKKEKIKEVKKEIKAFKASKKANGDPSTNTLLLVILAILLPPLAVYLHQGVINNKFWISLILTLLFWLPGVIYALIVVLGKD
ncbi:MAG: YqaE/Pmp3 family membrane protein [Chitinophagaceae bacterium]|nr:YqaE/Pmp3 family membrane protein [Chitinophagaceae bacterium]MBP8115629.1 YqaE/Pmp3 family membrane protein [Chitinophagaceae bacterium]MBP9104001.1 YqaE/Pmp3 family membrane protein [Chitinophagaceae bacterium]